MLQHVMGALEELCLANLKRRAERRGTILNGASPTERDRLAKKVQRRGSHQEEGHVRIWPRSFVRIHLLMLMPHEVEHALTPSQ